MKANEITAIGVSIIAIGVSIIAIEVVIGGLNWGVKEFVKFKKEFVIYYCKGGYGSEYNRYMRAANDPSNSKWDSQSFLRLAHKSLDKCLAEKGYSFVYKNCYPVCTRELKKIKPRKW